LSAFKGKLNSLIEVLDEAIFLNKIKELNEKIAEKGISMREFKRVYGKSIKKISAFFSFYTIKRSIL
jgi:hypothetical protein